MSWDPNQQPPYYPGGYPPQPGQYPPQFPPQQQPGDFSVIPTAQQQQPPYGSYVDPRSAPGGYPPGGYPGMAAPSPFAAMLGNPQQPSPQQYIQQQPQYSQPMQQQQGYPGMVPGMMPGGAPYANYGMPQQQQPQQMMMPPQTMMTSQPSMAMSSAAVPVTGKRKALLIGINYMNNPSAKLNGCISDVEKMKQYLVKVGFQESPYTMVILTDDQQDLVKVPTKQNIMNAMKWLVTSAAPGDSLFFHYSGHGGQVRDTSGDEADGMDETILPLDYQSAGQIIDDDIHTMLVKPLPKGCRLTSLMDCCHSGTGMDLPYVFQANREAAIPDHLMDKKALKKQKKMKADKKMKPEKKMKADKKAKKGKHSKNAEYVSNGGYVQDGHHHEIGNVILISGCMDDQTSADTTISTASGSQSGGAMTNAFLQAMSKLGANPTFTEIILAMRDILGGATGGRRYTQVPQLSSSAPLDMHQRFYI